MTSDKAKEEDQVKDASSNQASASKQGNQGQEGTSTEDVDVPHKQQRRVIKERWQAQ